MGNIAACLGAGLGWCFCSALTNLFTSCFGNDKPSTEPPGAASGRRRSVLLLILSLILSLFFQYFIAPNFQEESSWDMTGRISSYMVDAWTDGCEDHVTEKLRERCSGNSGVYRVGGSTLVFFALAALGAVCKNTANREAWPAKYVLFLFMVGGTIFIGNEPLFAPIYLNVGRVGAVLFIFMQQIILLDLAYNLNESWVEKANKAEEDEGEGKGKKWLGAILVMCLVLFGGSLMVIGLMFHYFSGCSTNLWFISITLIMSLLVTVLQLRGEEASLLTSSCVVAYATYLCLTAVSKNPNDSCNPKLGDEDVLGIFLGIGFTLLSLSWAGWSLTANKRMSGSASDEPLVEESSTTSQNSRKKKVTGVVTNKDDDDDANNNDDDDDDDVESNNNRSKTTSTTSDTDKPTYFSNSYKLNVLLILVSCWCSMALTGWGSIEAGGNAANPDVSRTSMWMIIASQWVAFSLYLWSLMAPTFFPDRDFS